MTAIDKSKLIPTGMVYSRTGKLPLEANKLFDTLALAQAYVNDPDQTAYVGYTVSVTADSDPKKNGLYYVKQIATAAGEEGVLEKVGAGSGSTTVATFTVEDGKVVEATEVGQVIYVTGGTEDYPAGPYIVVAEGSVSRLGTTSATGDIAGDVETLKTDMEAVEGEVEGVKSSIEGINSSIEGINSSVESLESNKATKDELEAAKGELSQAVADEKSAREQAIQGVQDQVTANAQAIEALNAATTFGGTGTYEQMQALTDVKAGTVWVISGDDAYANKEFVYDGSVWVELGDTSAEAQRISTLEGDMASVKSDLEVAKPEIAQAKLDIESLRGSVGSLESAVATKVEAEEGKGLSANDFTNELKAKLDGVAEGAQVNVLEGVQVNGSDIEIVGKKVNIDLQPYAKTTEVAASIESALTPVLTSVAGKLDKGATVNSKSFGESQSIVLGSADFKLSQAIGESYTEEDTVHGVLENMDERIKAIDADIQSALEGGVTGIESGNGITVDATTPTKPKVSLKLANVSGLQATVDGLSVKCATGSAIQSTADGLDIFWSSL